MKTITPALLTIVGTLLTFASAEVDAVFFDWEGCNDKDYGTLCEDLPVNICCSVSQSNTRAYWAAGFNEGGVGQSLEGTLTSSQNGNDCAIPVFANMVANFCGIVQIDTITGGYWSGTEVREMDWRPSKFVTPSAVFFRNGTDTYHIKTINVAKVDAFYAQPTKAEKLAYISKHYDYLKATQSYKKL